MACMSVATGAAPAVRQDRLLAGQLEATSDSSERGGNIGVAPTGGPAIGKTQWRTLAEIFDRKWSVFVLLILRKQTKRFKALQRALHGVSQKVLTATLRSLERDGLVSRTIYPTVPPKVEYALTDLGCKLAGHLATIGSFAAANGRRIEAVREQFDRKAAPRSDESSMTQAPAATPRP